MPVAISIASHSVLPGPREVAWAGEAVRRCGRATVLVASFAERDAYRRALADAGMGIAVEVETPSSWVGKLWELWGDGSRPADAATRHLLIAEALHAFAGGASASDAALRETAGTVDMLARAARSYLPYALDALGCATVALTASERALLGVLERYSVELGAQGYVETASASVQLAHLFARNGSPASERSVLIRSVTDFPLHLLELISALSAESEIEIVLDDETARVGDAIERALRARGVSVSRACDRACGTGCSHVAAAVVEVVGPTARDAAYTQLVSDVVAQGAGTVAVGCPRPVESCRALAPRLASRGADVLLDASMAFSETRAGEAVGALADFLQRVESEEPGAWLPAPELPDWLRSPFSGAGRSSRAARSLDVHLRKTRRLDRESLDAELSRLQSREQQLERERADAAGEQARPVVFKPVLDALAAGRWGRALRLMRDAAASSPASSFGSGGAAVQQVELGALDAALELLERARALGVGEERAVMLLSGLRVRASVFATPRAGATGPLAGVTVRFAPAPDIAACVPAAFEAAVLIDADAASYPLSHRTTVDELLAEKIGAAGVRPAPAARQRLLFRRALAAGSVSAVSFVGHDAHGEERAAALAASELRARFDAPADFAPLPTEGALFANLDPSGGEGAVVDDGERPAAYRLDDSLARYVLLPDRVVGGTVRPRTFSASQIENYLSCPFRWLVSNRVATRRLDVGFGPIEMGNFVHDVMQRFHERLCSCGLARVTPGNLDACLAEMDAAFSEIREDHARGKYTHGKYDRSAGGRPQTVKVPLVATDTLERGQIDAMLPKLREVVRYESDMLGVFVPERFEYSFDKEGVTYAGYPLGGRIDRIDVAPDAGSGERFVVIDYKNRSALGEFVCTDPTMMCDEGERLDGPWLPGRDQDRSPKVQTLIYASAYARLTGGSPQGAVYFGTRGPVVKGAVSAALVESEPPAFPHDAVSGYPGVKTRSARGAKHDGTMEFADLLEKVEEAVAVELRALASGRVEPDPAADSCIHCPLTMCPRRR